MNLILLREEDFVGAGVARLRGRRARHVREVLKAQCGDVLAAGKLEGPMGEAKVLATTEEAVTLEVRLEEPPPAPLGVDLLLALPRPKILRRVLRTVAALGVKRLVLVNSYRVEKSYFDSPLLEPAAIEEELLLGLEQARDTVLPRVEVRRRFKPFVEDELPDVWPAPVKKLVAHPHAETALGEEERGDASTPAVVAIGPEGGWVPYEVASLMERGFSAFSLGPRILRVDTAVPLILGQLDLLRRAVRVKQTSIW
jgi:RsmE family RNA methyltransferase